MPNYGDFGQQRYKEQAQMLNARGTQIVEQKTGRTQADGVTFQARGSRRQLIGTIIAIAAVFAALILLKLFDVI